MYHSNLFGFMKLRDNLYLDAKHHFVHVGYCSQAMGLEKARHLLYFQR